MVEAMLGGWRAQQLARGPRETTIAPRERLVRQFLAFTGEYAWQWGPVHVDEWTQSLAGERHLACPHLKPPAGAWANQPPPLACAPPGVGGRRRMRLPVCG
jgi:integrase/recombinase XerC